MFFSLEILTHIFSGNFKLLKYPYVEIKYLALSLQKPARNVSGKAKALKTKDLNEILGLNISIELLLQELKFGNVLNFRLFNFSLSQRPKIKGYSFY